MPLFPGRQTNGEKENVKAIITYKDDDNVVMIIFLFSLNKPYKDRINQKQQPKSLHTIIQLPHESDYIKAFSWEVH